MKKKLNRQANFDAFEERYGRERTEARRQIERRVLGQDVGLNGYTTRAQAHHLRDVIRLAPESTLLDLGCGHGWPGLLIARESRSRLVSTDIPMAALREAIRNIRAHGADSEVHVVAADGRALPFRAMSFDGVVHADVFC